MPVTRIRAANLFICVGKVQRPIGVDGQIKIRSYSDIPDRFRKVDTIYIGKEESLAVPYLIEGAESRGEEVVLKLSGLDSIPAVEDLRDHFCYIPRILRPELEEGEYYIDDIVGLQVHSTEGHLVGVVDEVMQSAGNDVLIIRDGKSEIMIPLVEPVVKSVNLETGRIDIDPIEGMIGEVNEI